MNKPLLPWLALALLLGGTTPAAADDAPRYERRWFYAMYNLQGDKNAEELIALIGRAGKAGYNGVVLADYKLNILDRVPPHYFKNLQRVKAAAAGSDKPPSPGRPARRAPVARYHGWNARRHSLKQEGTPCLRSSAGTF